MSDGFKITYNQQVSVENDDKRIVRGMIVRHGGDDHSIVLDNRRYGDPQAQELRISIRDVRPSALLDLHKDIEEELNISSPYLQTISDKLDDIVSMIENEEWPAGLTRAEHAVSLLRDVQDGIKGKIQSREDAVS